MIVNNTVLLCYVDHDFINTNNSFMFYSQPFDLCVVFLEMQFHNQYLQTVNKTCSDTFISNTPNVIKSLWYVPSLFLILFGKLIHILSISFLSL